MTDDLVERVAKAIYEEDDPWAKVWPWPNPKEVGADKYRDIARAAITACQSEIREECAKVAEAAERIGDSKTILEYKGRRDACMDIAQAIRSMKS